MNKGIKMAIICLIVLVFLYFVYAFFTVTKEGMETNEYAYLEPVTPENAVTDDTMDKFIDKISNTVIKPDATLTDSQNEGRKKGWVAQAKQKKIFSNLYKEKEVQYYLANDNWPIDKFTQNYIDYFKTLPEYKPAWDNFFSNKEVGNNIGNNNRAILNNLYNFQMYLKPGSKKLFDGTPEGKILNGYKTSENHNLFCPSTKDHMQQYDIDKTGKHINMTGVDFKTLPTLVPGFQFLNEPCDPCNWDKCQFSMDKQPTSDLFSNIWGLNATTASSISTTSPSSTPSTIASQNINPVSFPLFGQATASPSTAATLSANDQKISDAKANTADANASKAQADADKSKAEADKAKADADKAKTEAENAKKTLFQKIGF